MKPIIGITVNCTVNPDKHMNKGLALADQTIQYVADDYVKAVERAGGSPVLIPIIEDIESITPLLGMLKGIIFTGGSDIDPSFYNEAPSERLGEVKLPRDKYEINLAKKVLQETTIPYLGICRGSQLLNVACGGTLYQDIGSERAEVEEHSYFGRSPKHVSVHTTRIKEGSKLHQIVQSVELHINSFHHQAVKDVGQGLEVIATALDGTVEAIEMSGDRFVLAVQWHPEMMAETNTDAAHLFKHFIDICSK